MTPEPPGADLLGKGMPHMKDAGKYEASWASKAPTQAEPQTQKARGIKVLQQSGILPAGYARICTTLSQAHAALEAGMEFFRGCPITARHGFVDSVKCAMHSEVNALWSACKAADPQAEMIAMPFIPATHNMVWRPGLLAIGPGHDGATAGHHSVSVFLQSGYPDSWRDMSGSAGVNLGEQDPFIEAVVSQAHELVVTQIRAGVKGVVTEPDWNPYEDMTVGEVVTLDGSTKPTPDAMLAWETDVKKLIPGHHVVHDVGGNLGDHWAVHSQLNGVSVVTTFTPQVGKALPKLGVDLPPLEPQAVLFGFLGGIVAPSLSTPQSRKRAVCAALCGTHHGLRMGGDAGVFIGASVAMMLRLGQAAIWGEARYKDNGKGLKPPKIGSADSNSYKEDQIYPVIANDWIKGRDSLFDKGSLFWTCKTWGSGYGGPAWAACALATAELDSSILTLAKDPTVENAGAVLAKLTNAVNLAHNGGWWFNKFCGAEWFDYAAALDPRVALMAGPVWYDSTTARVDARLKVLRYLEQATAIDYSMYPKPKMNLVKPKAAPSVTLKTKVPSASASASAPANAWTKVGSFGNIGEDTAAVTGIRHHGKTVAVACYKSDSSTLHVQIGYTDYTYVSGNLTMEQMPAIVQTAGATMPSLSGSEIPYYVLQVKGSDVFMAGDLIVKGK